MPTNTPNYNLIKPDLTEFADIEVLNENFDKIDAAISQSIRPIATQPEAIEGTNNTKSMTPLRVNEAFRYRNITETNLDNLILSGRYHFSNFALLSNAPTQLSGGYACYLEVENRLNNDAPIQTLKFPSLNRAFQRTRNGTTSTASWLPWQELLGTNNIATTAQAQGGTDNNTIMTPARTLNALNNYGLVEPKLASATNPDTITTSGIYNVSFASSVAVIPNLPNGSYILRVFPSGSAVFQVFHAINQQTAGNVYVRYRNTNISSNWSVVKKLADSSDLGNLTELETTDKTSIVAAINEVKQQANSVSQNHYGVATGDSLLTITANPVPTSLYAGLTIQFKNTTANTGNVTINVNGLGYKNLTNNDGTQIQAGKLKPNSIYSAVYDGANFFLVKGGGEQNPIKNVQRGTSIIQGDSLSVTTPINAVDSSKSIIKFTIKRDVSVSGSSSTFETAGYFASNNSITFARNSMFGSGVQPGVVVHWEVVEFNENVRVLQGSAGLGDATLLDVTISSIDASKSILFFSSTTTGGEYATQVSGQIVTGTRLRFSKAQDSGVNTIYWYVVEFQ